jgi:hypothetical protein
MNRYLQCAAIAALGLASTCVLAQESTTPRTMPQDQTSTGAESHTTPSTTKSTKQASADSKEAQKQMMKDCVAKERASDSSMTSSQAKKACKEQMHSNSSTPKNY